MQAFPADPLVGWDDSFLEGIRCPPSYTEIGPLTSASALYRPGSLVPTYVDTASGPRVQDLYILDAKPLGRGSYGEVVGGTHRVTRARRAIKSVAKANLQRHVKNVSGFVRREVEVLRRLDHPNIVRLYEAFEDEENIHLVLELCEGGDLLERVTVARERLPEAEAAALLTQMLGALQHLYLRGVVHRDVKPENFLFIRREPDREPLPPKTPMRLIDFGLSRRLSGEMGMTITPKIGTAEYMAPEAFAGRVSFALADRADMWSVGVVLHVMFTGHFPSARLTEMPPEEYLSAACWKRISPSGLDFLGQMLRRDPSRRPTVTCARQHPWLRTPRGDSPVLLSQMRAATQTFASAPPLRRLALAAVAREVDDCETDSLRQLFVALDLECRGALTREGLDRLARKGLPLSEVAAGLAAAFEDVDTDASGTIDWTEIVAVALSNATGHDRAGEAPAKCAAAGCGSTMPPLSDTACWRAFEVLSFGSGAVSNCELCRLLAPEELGNRCFGSDQGCTGGTGDGAVVDTATPHLARLDRMVREIEPSGIVTRTGFTELARGK